MKVSIFNTKDYEFRRLILRVSCAFIWSMCLIPLILVISNTMEFNNADDVLLAGVCSLAIFAVPITLLIALLNDDKELKKEKLTHIVSYVAVPILLVIEPLYMLFYYNIFGKKYKRKVLYKMIDEIEVG